MKHGHEVAQFEAAFADRVGAKYCVSFANGTLTLQAALVALGVKPGDRVATTPLTMAATSIAILNVGAVPVFCDVDPRTWLMNFEDPRAAADWAVPVSLYGLESGWGGSVVDDAAQTLKRHAKPAAFTSYSLQSSKIISTGEGGVLVTDNPELARRAREYGSLGYRMAPDQARIESATLKSPTFERHHSLGINGRMNDVTAALGLSRLRHADRLLATRREAAAMYRQAISGCDWLTPQHVPDGWSHDYWAYTVAMDPEAHRVLWYDMADTIEKHGGERPYAAWRLTYHEPAFRHLSPNRMAFSSDTLVGERYVACPVAEDLQPRLLQFQTNSLASAEKNANALRLAIKELGG